MFNHKKLTRNILIALVLGTCVGVFYPEASAYFSWLGKIFKLSLNMIVMPIIITSIIGGMGSIGEVGRLERLGVKTLLYFLISTLMAIGIGLFLVNLIMPGERKVPLSMPLGNHVQNFEQISLSEFVMAQIDKSLVNPFEALADNNILAVIIFAILFGLALSRIGVAGKKVFELNDAAGQAINKLVSLVMAFAPFGVFGLLIQVIANAGAEVFADLAWYIACVVIGLFLHIFIALPALMWAITQKSPLKFFKQVRPVLAVAFSTSSSSATLPVTLNVAEEELKIPRPISRFVIPLGSTVNMNGTALYEAVAALFVAQLYGATLGLQGQIIVVFTATLAAVGAAGIPAAGTVTMALVLSAVGLPVEAIGLLLAVDRPLDMCRTSVNVIGDLVGCVILQKIAKDDIKPLNAKTM